MAKVFEFQGPDGKTHTIEGPDDATPEQAFQMLQQQLGAQPSTAMDVLKSAGTGIVKGALGLTGLAGDVESLGRFAVDKGAEALGYDSPGYSGTTVLPTSKQVIEGAERKFGKFYEPQTTAGQYAETVGEFLPGSVAGPGRMATKLAVGATSGAASEAAGQATEGTALEPWARMGAAFATPLAVSKTAKAITPVVSKSPEHTRLAEHLRQNEGVHSLTAGQRTGNEGLKGAESHLGQMPGAGNRLQNMTQRQGEEFTGAAMRRVGSDANRTTAQNMDEAFDRIGQQFDDLAARNFTRMDADLDVDLNTVWNDYSALVNESQRAPIVADTINDIYNALGSGRPFTGERYQAWRSRLDRQARKTSDPQLREALLGIRNALDDNMARHMTPEDAAAWAEARRQYRNIIPIEDAASKAGADAAEGILSPSTLRNSVVAQNKRAYVRGEGDLADLARAGEAVMKPVPQSGTPWRTASENLLRGVGNSVGSLLMGKPGVASAELLSSVSPSTAGRILMHPWTQWYLSNQGTANFQRHFDPRTLAMIQLLNSADAGAEGVTLRGGIGPRYEDGNLRK